MSSQHRSTLYMSLLFASYPRLSPGHIRFAPMRKATFGGMLSILSYYSLWYNCDALWEPVQALTVPTDHCKNLGLLMLVLLNTIYDVHHVLEDILISYGSKFDCLLCASLPLFEGTMNLFWINNMKIIIRGHILRLLPKLLIQQGNARLSCCHQGSRRICRVLL